MQTRDAQPSLATIIEKNGGIGKLGKRMMKLQLTVAVGVYLLMTPILNFTDIPTDDAQWIKYGLSTIAIVICAIVSTLKLSARKLD